MKWFKLYFCILYHIFNYQCLVSIRTNHHRFELDSCRCKWGCVHVFFVFAQVTNSGQHVACSTVLLIEWCGSGVCNNTLRSPISNNNKKSFQRTFVTVCLTMHTPLPLSLPPSGPLCPSTALSANQIIYCLQMACTAVSVCAPVCVRLCLWVRQGYYSQFELKCNSSHTLGQLTWNKHLTGYLFSDINSRKCPRSWVWSLGTVTHMQIWGKIAAQISPKWNSTTSHHSSVRHINNICSV